MSKCYNQAIKIKKKILNEKKTYVCFSGGKDSTAMLLRLIEKNIKIDEIVFADTGFEFPELYQYIKKIEKHIKRKITILKPDKNLWNKWFYGKITRGKNKGKIRGMPLYAYPCWYSRESKIKPLQKYMSDAKIIYVGIAYDEMQRCGDDPYIKYPLVDWKWSEQDCVNYLNNKNLLNPLYKNYNRLGCYFCPKQNINSLYSIYKTNKNLWDDIKKWDLESYKVSKHYIKDKPMEEYQKIFNNNYKPKKLPLYECKSCDAVASAFKIRQTKINNYIKNERH